MLDQARQAEGAARTTRDQHQNTLGEAHRAAIAAARLHHLDPEPEALDQRLQAVTRLDREGHELLHHWERLDAAAAQLAEARSSLALRARDLEESAERLEEVTQTHLAHAAELEALEQRLGAEARAMDAELEALRADQRRAAHERKAASSAREQSSTEAANLGGRLSGAREHLDGSRQAHQTARERLHVFARPGLARLLQLPELSPGDETLPAALATAVQDAAHTPDRLKAVGTQLLNRTADLDQRLGSGLRALQDVDDDLLLIEISGPDGRRPAAVAAERLHEEHRTAATLLAERERRVFEDTLLQSLCTELHRSVRDAHQLVDTMDAEMRQRKLSSGVAFGVKWVPRDDLDPATREVLRRLRHDPAHLGSDALATVGEHLRRAIDAERRGDAASYAEVLRRALDYRTWHRFELHQLRTGAPARPLTRKAYAQLSGGEKASASHCPLFAAAHAHFSAGAPHAPHLIALDEAFEGIDERGRPELLALTVAFDLDLFLTGYDLWIASDAVPGAAHYELEHDPTDQIVTATRVVWRAGALEYLDASAPVELLPASR